MWQSKKNQETKKNFTDDVQSPKNSDEVQIDSGFLSGANIGVHIKEEEEEEKNAALFHGEDPKSLSNPREYKIKDVRNIEKEEMRVDSGILEVGLSNTLSQLTLKPVTINRLRGKVQSEPTVELSPVTDPLQQETTVNIKPKLDPAQELWQLYFSQDEDGDTQLHIAIVQGFHEGALSLIRMSPHPSVFDCLNHKRQSPLHLAVLTHQPSIVRHLILAGADPGLRNSDGNMALHLASASGDIACAKALTDPVSTDEIALLPAGKQTPSIPQDLEQRNYEGETCLHAAVVAGNTEIVRLLIRVGADLEAKERLGGRTALHLAIECRRKAVTSLLLKECHPQLDALTYGGVTPYEIAASWDSQLAKELLNLGASPSNVDYKNTEELSKIPQIWQNVTVGLRA